ncbi:MAG: hypothetical protein GXO63_01150 [Candidatus Micrarchaeota archaeon]|nr:hypothetical protein [Candidatus Micrarchaeota archaeon]
MKVCLISSAGGHLTEILQLREAFEKYEHFFVTFNRNDVKHKLRGKRVYFICDPKRNPFKFVKNFFQTLKIFLKEKPNVIISTGAGMALPMILLGKIFRKKVVFIESMAAVYRPSFAGRIAYHLSDLFIIQWKQLSKYYPKAAYGGTLI